MLVDIIIPSPGESITEVTLGAWHKRSGEWVNKDEPLVEIESDKVTFDVLAPEAGLLKVLAESGTEKKVRDKIGTVDPSAKSPSSANGVKGEAPPPTPQPHPHSHSHSPPPSPSSSSSAATHSSPASPDHPARNASSVEAATERAAAKADESSRATPVARKIAADKGIDLAKVQGTGPSGRVRKSDVIEVARRSASGIDQDSPSQTIVRSPSTAPHDAERRATTSIMHTPSSAIDVHGQRGIRREKMSKLRQRIAERLVSAQHTAAMLTTFNEVDCGEMMRLRSLHKEDFERRHNVGLGFMSFFVKAAVSALQKFPRVNAYIVSAPPDGGPGAAATTGSGGTGVPPVGGGAEIEYHDFCDVSVAVGTEKGLVVPVIRNAELMTFADVEAAIKDFATRAKTGKLTIDEMTGGTFTISNGGTYGSLNSTPILNPPQSGILGMHAIKKRAIEYPKDSGQIALRPMMYVALSYDHRIVDGAEAVGFLVHIKNAIENPERMLLGL